MKNTFNEKELLDKIKSCFKYAGVKSIYFVLILYFTLQRDDIPRKAKAIIVGALVYFISPLDAIPDVAFGFGYTDDFVVLAFAISEVALYIDNDIKKQAKNKLQDWFNLDEAYLDKSFKDAMSKNPVKWGRRTKN